MTQKTQKVITTSWVFIVVAGSFGALINIINLNQPILMFYVALAVWAVLWFWIAFLYDLHFKNRQVWNVTLKNLGEAFYDRFKHLLLWKEYSRALHYLLLPGLLFWSTVVLFYIELGHGKIQFIFAALTTLALTLNYYFIKEVFSRKSEIVDEDIFVSLSVVKVYAAAVVFGSTMAIMRRFCLEPTLFSSAIFSLTFLLIYQALHQHKLVNARNFFVNLVIAGIMAVIAHSVYIFWGYNFYTAAIFFAAVYNLLWGGFHYWLDRALTPRAFAEIVLVCLVISGIVFSATNFRARLLDDCRTYWQASY